MRKSPPRNQTSHWKRMMNLRTSPLKVSCDIDSVAKSMSLFQLPLCMMEMDRMIEVING